MIITSLNFRIECFQKDQLNESMAVSPGPGSVLLFSLPGETCIYSSAARLGSSNPLHSNETFNLIALITAKPFGVLVVPSAKRLKEDLSFSCVA